IVFRPDGTLFVTLGERFNYSEKAQDLSATLGKVVRINPDGSAPRDNPFVDRAGDLVVRPSQRPSRRAPSRDRTALDCGTWRPGRCGADPAASGEKSCTSGRAGGLICEPLKAVWPAYAGIVTRIF